MGLSLSLFSISFVHIASSLCKEGETFLFTKVVDATISIGKTFNSVVSGEDNCILVLKFHKCIGPSFITYVIIGIYLYHVY